MKCPTCESCEYAQYCGATEIMRKCERHNKKVEQTNEEWFCSLSTEEKAKWIAEEKMNRGYFIFPSMEEAIQDALDWLKEKHND